MAALILRQAGVPNFEPFDRLGESELTVSHLVSTFDFPVFIVCITTGTFYLLCVHLSHLTSPIPCAVNGIIFTLWLRNWRFRRYLPMPPSWEQPASNLGFQ